MMPRNEADSDRYDFSLQPVSLNNIEKDSRDLALTLQPQLLPNCLENRQLTTDDLWTMWNVATKAKSSIYQGQRLENLSWRLWYKTALQSPSRCSQAIDSSLSNACSSIIREIQQASHSLHSLHHNHPTPIHQVHDTESISEGASSIECFKESLSSNFRKKTCNGSGGNEYLTRRKKKNIERYMKKQQKRLDDIPEEEQKENDDDNDCAADHTEAGHQPSDDLSSDAVIKTDISSEISENELLLFGKRKDITAQTRNGNPPSMLSVMLSKVFGRKEKEDVGKSGSDGAVAKDNCNLERPCAPVPVHCSIALDHFSLANDPNYDNFCNMSDGLACGSLEDEFVDCFESINDGP